LTAVKLLLFAGVAHIGRDDSTFTRILTSRSLVQLRKIFEEYKSIAGKPLDEAIKSQFSGEAKDALVALGQEIIKFTENDLTSYMRNYCNLIKHKTFVQTY
jgi:hypothetical protein